MPLISQETETEYREGPWHRDPVATRVREPILPVYHRIAVLFNPAARGGRRYLAWRSRLEAVLRDLQIEATWVETSQPGDGTVLAREWRDKPIDMLLVCGGDGTVNEVVNGWVGSSVPIGVLPFGTSNIMATLLGTKGGLEHACLKLFYGRPQPYRLARANGRYFVLMVGAGFDGEVVRRIDLKKKKKWLHFAFAFEACRVAFGSKHRVSVQIFQPAPQTYQGAQVIVTLVPNYAGFLKPVPPKWFRRSPMWAVIFKKEGPVHLIKYLAGMLTGNHVHYRDVVAVPGHSLEITAISNGDVYEVDGDYGGTLPIRVTLTEDFIRFVKAVF